MNFIKNNLAIIIAFALPVIIVIGVTLSVYISASLISTEYKFLYVKCSDTFSPYSYNCQNYLQEGYSVADNHLNVISPEEFIASLQERKKAALRPSVGSPENYQVGIFIYNTDTDQSHEITLAEAQDLHLSNLSTSPDGITISDGWSRGADIFPFFNSGSSYNYYLSDGRHKKTLSISNADRRYYDQNIRFLGWIIPNNQ